MLFWKTKKEDIVVQCPVCEWNPDGEIHWACSCGHKWNTFETKGVCPKCKFQWKDTRCPACGKSTSHKDWYKTKEEIEKIENSGDPILRAKKITMPISGVLFFLYVWSFCPTHGQRYRNGSFYKLYNHRFTFLLYSRYLSPNTFCIKPSSFGIKINLIKRINMIGKGNDNRLVANYPKSIFISRNDVSSFFNGHLSYSLLHYRKLYSHIR